MPDLNGTWNRSHANSAYPALEYTLQALGYDRIHVATVEGFPELKDVMHRIEQKQYRKVALLPFMFVAGDHAKNDMAGDEDSWKCELEEAGYEVRPLSGFFSGTPLMCQNGLCELLSHTDQRI